MSFTLADQIEFVRFCQAINPATFPCQPPSFRYHLIETESQ
jgi:hypothetical protein